MVLESDAAVPEYLDHLIEEGRIAIRDSLKVNLENFSKNVPESTIASSSENFERILTARFEQSMRSLEPAKLMNLYVQRETYPFSIVVASATQHMLVTFVMRFADLYMEQQALQQISDTAQRQQIEEALFGRVFGWLCPIWPFC